MILMTEPESQGQNLVLTLSSVKMAHIRQSRPDSGLYFLVKVLNMYQVFPLAEGGCRRCGDETGLRAGDLQLDWVTPVTVKQLRSKFRGATSDYLTLWQR